MNNDIHSVAQAVLSRALGSADYEQAGEMITYGNQAGRSLLTRDEGNDEEVGGCDGEQRVNGLTQSSKGYRKIRHRFLDVSRNALRSTCALR